MHDEYLLLITGRRVKLDPGKSERSKEGNWDQTGKKGDYQR
jgi:hypothetical protein